MFANKRNEIVLCEMVMDFGDGTLNITIKAANDTYSRPILEYLVEYLGQYEVLR